MQGIRMNRYPRRRLRVLAATCSMIVGVAHADTGSSVLDLGYAAPNAISPGGDVIVGTYWSGVPFRWTSLKGYQPLKLGALQSLYSQVEGTGVSADGNVVIAAASTRDNMKIEALRWTPETGWSNLGGLNGGSLMVPRGINYAGNVIVGEVVDGNDPDRRFTAYRWTADKGIETLGYLNGGALSQAFAVNAAGDVVVGDANNGPGRDVPRVAFRWTRETGMVSLGSLYGPTGRSKAQAVNAAGDVVAGYATDQDNENWRAFRWTAATGMQNLGSLNQGSDSWVGGISGSGDVIVGTSVDGSDGRNRGYRWTRATGMQSIEKWLSDAGVQLAAEQRTAGAAAVSADGSVVVGRFADGDAFIARVPAGNTPAPSPTPTPTPAPSPGIISVNDYSNSLHAMGKESKLPLQEQRMVLHGAHGTPLQNLLQEGQRFVRANGDVGQRTAALGLRRASGEIGFGYGISDRLQVQLAAGRTISRQDLPRGGSAGHQGFYVLPELIWQALPDAYFSISGYHNDGQVDVRRAYANGAGTDVSSGRAHTGTSSVRLRLDLNNAAHMGRLAFSPYASITWSRLGMSGYSESGGSFPAAFDSRTMRDKILRIGTFATAIVHGDIELDASAEVGYRLNDMPRVEVRGRIAGIGDFSISELDSERRIWPRVGAGMSIPLGRGKLANMLNATKRDGNTAYWLATSYSMKF